MNYVNSVTSKATVQEQHALSQQHTSLRKIPVKSLLTTSNLDTIPVGYFKDFDSKKPDEQQDIALRALNMLDSVKQERGNHDWKKMKW